MKKIILVLTVLFASLIFTVNVSAANDGGLVENSDYWVNLSFDEANSLMYQSLYGVAEDFILVDYSRECYWCQQTIPKIKQYAETNKILVYGIDKYNKLGGTAQNFYCPGNYFDKTSLGYVVVFMYNGMNKKMTAQDSVHDIDTFEDMLISSRLYNEGGDVYGDIYKDGFVNSKDSIKLSQYLAKWNVSLNSVTTELADVFYDGNINSKDAIKLGQYLAKWNVTLGK